MDVTVTIRKWGNSLGAVFPQEFVKAEGLKEGQQVSLCLMKKADFGEIFGTLKTRMTGQQFKDLAREGWYRGQGFFGHLRHVRAGTWKSQL